MVINFVNAVFENAPSWSLILRGLKAESGLDLYDDKFEEWVLKEWNIKLLHGSQVYPEHLTGMEIDDRTMTMLMLKFPKAFSGRA